MRTKLKLIYILPGLFVAAFLTLVLIGNLGPSVACHDKLDFVKSSFNGMVLSKFLDRENHNYRTIIYSIKGDSVLTRLLDDTSAYFTTVKKGDIVEKKAGSEYLLVNKHDMFKINFDCN